MNTTPVLCPDCNTPEGTLHKFFPYCDQEICPLCLDQLLACPHVARPEDVEKAGRIPFLYFPSLCAKCGTIDPDFFRVTDKEWRTIIPKPYWDLVLCRSCYDALAALQVSGGTLGRTWGTKRRPPVDDVTLQLL